MALSRRGFLAGLFAAPAVVKIPGLLMPVKPIITIPDNKINLIIELLKQFNELLEDIPFVQWEPRTSLPIAHWRALNA